nr:MAG TPA: hypothetical protein [Caudoviricetes sp.]
MLFCAHFSSGSPAPGRRPVSAADRRQGLSRARCALLAPAISPSRPIPLLPLIGLPALSRPPFRVLSNFQPGPIFSARTPGKRFFDPLPKKILRLRTRRGSRAR